MSAAKSWRTDPEGRIEFRDSRGFLRAAFGTMVMLFGAFFLSAMVAGLFRPGGWQAALSRPGNTLGVMSFALFFFAIGWFGVVYRVRIILDPAAREITIVHEMFPFAHKRTRRLEDFRAAVMVTSRTLSTGKSRSELVYSVRLIKPDKQSELVAAMYSVADASKLGSEIAGMLGGELIEMSESQWDRAFEQHLS